jgi:hypothetical protein
MAGSMGMLAAAGAKATVQGNTKDQTKNKADKSRFLGQHVRFGRCIGASQGRNRSCFDS